MASPAITRIKRPTRCHHDFETFSETDLTKVGASRYSRHETTEVLMCAYALDNAPVKQWVPVEGQLIPAELEDAILDDRVRKFAWNKPFEWNIWTHTLGMRTPHSAWRDPMVMALTCSLPGKLDKAGKVMGLSEDFLKKDGKRLINWFSKLRPATTKQPARRVNWFEKPDLWAEYLEYNRFDVEAERKIYLNLSRYDLPDHEWELYALDQEINDRGIPINMKLVENAIQVRDDVIENRLAHMREVTGLANPNSVAQLLEWAQDQGYKFNDLKAGHVRRALRMLDDLVTGGDAHHSEIRDLFEVLTMRGEISKTSTKKFDALANMVDEDGRLRNAHQFAGAGRTWRWAGRGFQIQNLARPERGLDGLQWVKLDSGHQKVVGGTQIMAAKHVTLLDAEALEMLYAAPMDLLSGCVRTVIEAPDGYVFIDADLAAIENVVLGWMSGETKITDVFEKGRDPYIDFATFLYKRSYDELFAEYKPGGDKSKRTIAKPGVLGCLKGDTPVLTNSGWKAIVELTSEDWVHDGVSWVRHEGVAFRGHKEVLCRSGLHATSDHQFLTESGWVEWESVSLPKMFKSALDTASGLLSSIEAPAEAPGRSSCAGVDVGSRESFLDRTSSEGRPHVAPDALLLTVAPRSENELAQTCSTFSQIVSTLRERVAKTRQIVPTFITEAGEFVCGSGAPKSGSGILSMSSVRTGFSKLIESTTTGTTNQETCVSQLAPSRTRTADTWDILNTGDFARFVVLTESGCLVAHNCGYMLSAGEQYEDKQTGEIEATGLLGYAWNMGVKLTPEQAELSVKVWRETYQKAVDFWYDIDRAARKCIRTGDPTSIRDIRFDRKGPFMRMILPSERALHYVRPRLEEWKMPWGEYKLSITYEQLNDRQQWDRISTHPGKLTENADQAIARDILAHGMRLAAAEGIDIVFHVHDQIVGMVKEDEAEAKLKVLLDCMAVRPKWAPTIPARAAGHISKWFVKD